jgi:hypothetical protein
MAFGHATPRTDTPHDSTLAPALAVLITSRPAASSMRVSPTLRAQGLPAFLIELPASPHAAQPPLLRERPAQCIAFVDAPAGVMLARELGTGLVVGLGSGSRGTGLLDAGADLAIGTPAELCAGGFYDEYARRFHTLPDPLTARVPWHAEDTTGGDWGVLLDGRSLLRARGDAAVIAALRRLPARVPIAILGGAEVRVRVHALGLERADALSHDGLSLAPAGLLDAARPRIEAAAMRLGALATELGIPRPRDDGVGLRLDLPGANPSAPVRRMLLRAVGGLAAIEWEVDTRGLDLRPVLNWPVAQRLAALRQWWSQRSLARRVLLITGSTRYEEWLRALRPEDAGVLVADRPEPTAAAWRVPGSDAVARLLGLLHR